MSHLNYHVAILAKLKFRFISIMILHLKLGTRLEGTRKHHSSESSPSPNRPAFLFIYQFKARFELN